MDNVKIQINGQEIAAEKGARLLDVCLQNNFAVPHLCYFERLEPYAGCRTCVVEIEGVRGTPVSCTATVTDGMVVWTDTPKLDEIRHGTMEYILCDHPGRCFDCHRLEHCGPGLICLRDEIVTERCLTCAKNRFCELQEVSEHIDMRGANLYYEEKQAWYGEENDRQVMRVIRTNPFIELEFDKCIICTRCVRVCDEVRGRGVFTLSYKGPNAKIDTMFGVPLQDTDCEFCGACVDVCPTAAIMDKRSKWAGIPDQTVETICPHCSVGCGLKVAVKKGRITGSFPDFDSPVNRGQICARGRYGLEFVQDENRLTTPLIRKNGELEEASWDEALNLVSVKLKSYSGDEFGLVTSAGLTNEDNYLAQKFTRVAMGSNNVDHGSSLLDRDTQRTFRDRLGEAASTNTWRDLADAKCILILDGSITKSHVVAGIEVMEAARRNGGRLIVAASERPEIVDLVGSGCIWLQIKAGSEGYLAAGLARALVDGELLPEGVDVAGAKKATEALSVAQASAITGVIEQSIRDAAAIFGKASPASVIFPAELPWLADGADAVNGLVNLTLAGGTLGAPSGGLYALLPAANSQGTLDVGAAPDMLPGHRDIVDDTSRGEVGEFWGVTLPAEAGRSAAGIYEAAAAGTVKALYIIGENPAAGPNATLIADACRNAEFTVVQDVTLTETAQLADVVLPGATFAEKQGTMTNNERRIQLLSQVIPAIGEARPDWLILAALGHKAVGSGFEFGDAGAVMDEIAQVTPIYAGVSHFRLESGGLAWPVSANGANGSESLYDTGFGDGKGSMIPLQLAMPKQTPDVLTLKALNAGGPRGLVERGGVGQLVAAEIVEISAGDARRLCIKDGDPVAVSATNGSVTATARISAISNPGAARVSLVFGETVTALRNGDGALAHEVRLTKA